MGPRVRGDKTRAARGIFPSFIGGCAAETARREAVRRAHKKKVVIEASGNVTLKTVRAIAETGVHVISVGALTHSAPAVDFSLLITEEKRGTAGKNGIKNLKSLIPNS